MNQANLFAVFLSVFALLPIGCRSEATSTEAAVESVTYLDRETGETVAAPPQEVPAVNPATGNATLVRAGWCEACRKWYPIPPEVNPGQVVCRQHKTPLDLEGPGTGTATTEAAP